MPCSPPEAKRNRWVPLELVPKDALFLFFIIPANSEYPGAGEGAGLYDSEDLG